MHRSMPIGRVARVGRSGASSSVPACGVQEGLDAFGGVGGRARTTTVRRAPSRSPGRTGRARATRAVRSRAAPCPRRGAARAIRTCGRRSSGRGRARVRRRSAASAHRPTRGPSPACAARRPTACRRPGARRSASRGNRSKASSSPALDALAAADPVDRQDEVLLDRERAEHRAALRSVGDAGAGELVRRLARHVDTVDADRAGGRGDQPGRDTRRSWSCRRRSGRRGRPLRPLRS